MNGARTPPASLSPERQRSAERDASPLRSSGSGSGGGGGGADVLVAQGEALVQPMPLPHSPTPTPPLTASRPPSDISLASDSAAQHGGGGRRRASLTARNLGRIPDADEVAPGIRLPGSHDEDARRRDTREMARHDDEEQRGRSDGTPLGSEAGADEGVVGHYGEGGAPVGECLAHVEAAEAMLQTESETRCALFEGGSASSRECECERLAGTTLSSLRG
ncbi:hypothetical protein FA09DRAFT_331992 [Tilletiopsis washingtonensis]|jgi:hypothetical protein|uniref:Uncharacterized protein n=1 Tax=Tilletiopsis washingtonensis TaxID=58919 RepID=A0A316Z6A9_9BASI|nr:hypothetical protein FA09DRAFT_331992 [Tilletiopsis washingtonensis]PWN95673.1 hypothetical protein FA09DRAFT_331992 [Tilletiopsis washingtonensis]